jgi:60 kDa SS-A/Ro ribonucleoprotein
MKQFPYQYLAAYRHADAGVPAVIRQALGRAAEAACGNVPELPGPVVVGLDVSGSMASPVTGQRGRGATTALRCVDLAAVFAAAVLRRNPASVVVPFDTQAYGVEIDPAAPILTLADRLAQYGGGGTDCSTPLAYANRHLADRPFAGCVLVSDNESWVGQGRGGATAVLTEWERFAARQRRHGVADPKLVCIDVQPSTTTQAPDRADVLNVGGFSDAVFDVVAAFLAGNPARFVAEVEAVEV